MTCCHEVISARHMDYIFLQFNAEMNQIVYSGRYRVTGARLLRVRSRARVATGPKSIALLPLWFLKLSRTPKALHFLLHVFIFSLLSLVIFLLGEGRDWPTFCVFLIQDWKNLCSLGTRRRIEGKRRKKKIGVG